MILGKQICLRALEPDDRDLMYSWENDPRHWAVSGTLSPYSRHTVDEFLRGAQEDIYTNRQLRLVIDKNGHHEKPTIGYVDLFDFDPPNLRAGIGILIGDESERGKGFASETVVLVCKYAGEVLNLNQLYCHIHSDNESSIRLFTKNGFTPVGKLQEWTKIAGQWKDVVVFQRLLRY
ncbi:MAG: GNAT family N-acetyltransferase [Bacteroidota bacterium]